MKIWFTSDQHFGHANIIKNCNRPYRDVEEMNEALIANYNAKVQTKDTCYFLGDTGFLPVDHMLSLLWRLNGRKILIYGNHDKEIRKNWSKFSNVFAEAHDYLEIKVNKQRFVLCHYPIVSWNGSTRDTIMLHGHTHGTLERNRDRRFDVGVDCHNFAPISYE